MKISFIRLNGYYYCHNSCSKCSTFARTHERRRSSHSSTTVLLVNDTVIHVVLNMQKTLQFINVVCTHKLIHSLCWMTPHVL